MSEVVSGVTSLVASIGVMLGTVGGLIVAILKGRTGHNKNLERIEAIGESLKSTDAWILENEGKIKTVTEVVTNLSPEAKAALEKKGMDINKLTADLNFATDELKKLYGVVPAANIQNPVKLQRVFNKDAI